MTPEKDIIGVSPVKIRPRTKTIDLPAFSTSPVHSTRSPTCAGPMNSPPRLTVTACVPSSSLVARENRQASAKVMTQPPCMKPPPFMCRASARKAQRIEPSASSR
jgi:hypothetical protein